MHFAAIAMGGKALGRCRYGYFASQRPSAQLFCSAFCAVLLCSVAFLPASTHRSNFYGLHLVLSYFAVRHFVNQCILLREKS